MARPPSDMELLYQYNAQMVSIGNSRYLLYFNASIDCPFNTVRLETNCSMYGRQLFPMHFLEWKCFVFCWSFIEIMMTSSNGNIFRVTSPLCGKFTGPQWIPHTKASDAELWCFLWSTPNKRLSKQMQGWWFETHSPPLWRHSNVLGVDEMISNYLDQWWPSSLMYYMPYHLNVSCS